jgi:hypothetical protein
MLAQFLLSEDGPPSADNQEATINIMVASMLTIDLPLLIAALLLGFVGGYAIRDLKSRQRRRRLREKYWYGPPPTSTRTALERGMSVSAQRAIYK